MDEETKQENTEELKVVNKHDFYFETPLYEVLGYSQIEDVENLLSGDVDAYSSKNNTDTTYDVEYDWVVKTKNKYINQYNTICGGFGLVTLKCKRKENDVGIYGN